MKPIGISTLLVVLLIILNIGSTSCKKEPVKNNDTIPQDTVNNDSAARAYMEKIFEAMVLNQPIRIILAVDSSGNNLTANYQDMVIYLRKDTYYAGPLEILAQGTKHLGTWSSNSDYSRLNLEIQGVPEFAIFNSNPWRFTYKSINLLKIAPVNNPGQKTLHLEKEL
jgi:hypothetical protein